MRAAWSEMVNAYGFTLEPRARLPGRTRTPPLSPRPKPIPQDKPTAPAAALKMVRSKV